jgi:hypothetical protein
MKHGYAVVHMFQGLLDDVRVFSIKENAQENWFGQMKEFLDENPHIVKFCKETGGNFKKFVKAIEKNKIRKSIEFYNLIEWDEEDSFTIVTCEIFE